MKRSPCEHWLFLNSQISSFVWISEISSVQASYYVHATECIISRLHRWPKDNQSKTTTWPVYRAFDCLFSDSPWHLFSWLIGTWREFRPSSSWVFGSWEAANSGRARDGFEIPKYRKCRPPRFETPLSRKVGVSGMKIPLLGHKIEWNSKP